MYSRELKNLMKASLADGIITNKERDAIHKKALSEGVNPDEVDVFLDAELHRITEEGNRKRRKVFVRILLFLIIFIVAVYIFIPKSCSIQGGDDNNSYQEAARAHDFEKAHQILDQIQEDYLSESNSFDKVDKKDKYEKAFDYVFNAEAMYLCARGDKQSIDRIVFLVSEIPVEGTPIIEGTKYKPTMYTSYKFSESHDIYIRYATRVNQKCDNMIDLAISNHNYYLVEKILPLYKKIPEAVIIERDKDAEQKELNKKKKQGYHSIVITPLYKEHTMSYSDADRKRAVEKINKAIDDGVFPNVTEHIK